MSRTHYDFTWFAPAWHTGVQHETFTTLESDPDARSAAREHAARVSGLPIEQIQIDSMKPVDRGP